MSEIKFVELQKELFDLFEKGNISNALSLINRAQSEFPERLDKTLFWKACFFSVQKKNEEAIAALHEGLNKGVWWNPHTLTSDPDLRPLQAYDEFKRIVRTCEEILNKHRKNSKSELITYGNYSSVISIFSLHWRGSNVKDFAPYWLKENSTDQYLFGFPQSSQIYSYNAYCWDNQDITLKEVKQTYKEFKDKYDTKLDIIAGASQGGKLSIELSLNKSLSGIKGFIAVIPAIEDISSIESLIKENDYSDLKGCIITGDKDPFYKKVLELMPIFEASNIDCKLIVKEGLGHFFPNDFAGIVSESVDYILQKEK